MERAAGAEWIRLELAWRVNVPTAADFERTNAYYVWTRIAAQGPQSPLATPAGA